VYVTGNNQFGSGVKRTYIVREECANIDRLVLCVEVFSDQCVKNVILVLVFYWNLFWVTSFLKCFTHAALSNRVLIRGINKLIHSSRINVLMCNNPHVHPLIF